MATPMSQAEASFGFGYNPNKIRLNSNENPYGPSDKARQAFISTLKEGNRYPFDALD